MRRRSSPKPQAGGVSLFPFLAVLLCTMGALIVVLIVIARQARIQVAEDSGDSTARAEFETQKADLEWRIEMLRQSRGKTLEQLESQRQELSHLEDHSRRLGAQLEELEQARREFEKLAAGGDVEAERLKREIDEINAKIAAKERALDEAVKKGAKGQSYAVVPYHGPNETRRRPIYIECRSDGVVFQPEGLVLTEKDFEGDLGPGCPLISALRAAREYLSRNQLPGEEGAPYPLLLVRPDGIIAYECVQTAITQSWGSEFGYELIGQEWALDFPPPDPKLTLAMRQAIGEGRLRQAYLAHAAPRLRSSGNHAFRASPTGGLMRDDGMPLDAESQMARRGGVSGRPSWARRGPSGGASDAGRSGSRDQAKTAPKRGANPYAAALHGQSTTGGTAGRGAGTTLGSGQGSLLGVGAGDLVAERLSAAPDSPSGVLFHAPGSGTSGAGTSLLGSASGASAVAASNSLAADGKGGPAGQRGSGLGAGGANNGGLAAGKPGTGAAPGRGAASGQAGRGGSGRGWTAGQDKIDDVAARLGTHSGGAPAGDAATPDARAAAALGGAAGRDATGGRGGDGAAGGARSQQENTANAAPAGGNVAGMQAGGASDQGGGSGGPALGPAQPGDKADGAEGGDASLAGGPAPSLGVKGGKASAGSDKGGKDGDSAEGVASAGSATGGTKADGSGAKGAGSKNSAAGGRDAGRQSSLFAGDQSAGASGTSSLASGGGGSGQPQQPGAMPVPIPMPNMTLGNKSAQKSIAEQRGEKNWANPAANHAAFPNTRPIRIVCDADHLTMLPEGRSRRGYKVIELGEDGEANARELVTSVWDRIESWGAAGQGMYWRPELIMEVEQGAEERFKELKTLMADSGLDVSGRPRNAAAVRYPRTKTPN